ncbi:L-lactate oxidase [Dirofilaria immitis]
MVELVRAQSAVALRPSYSTTIYRTRSVPDLSLYSRYIPKWPYRYYKDWDLYDDYWYDRYYYYSPLYRITGTIHTAIGLDTEDIYTLIRRITVDTITIMTIIHAIVTHISTLIVMAIIHRLIVTRFRPIIGIDVLGIGTINVQRAYIHKIGLVRTLCVGQEIYIDIFRSSISTTPCTMEK